MMSNDAPVIIFFPVFMILAGLYVLYPKNPLLILNIVWIAVTAIYFSYLKFKAKKMGLPERTFCFNHHYEPHIEGLAKNDKNKFIRLFIDRILVANEQRFHKTMFISWYVTERQMKQLFGKYVTVDNPSRVQKFSTIVLNNYRWFHRTKKDILRVTIYTDMLTLEQIEKLKTLRIRLFDRENSRKMS